MIKFTTDKTISLIRYGQGSIVSLPPYIEEAMIEEGAAETVKQDVVIHPYYHFHGFAGDQLGDDEVFFDKAVGNHAIPGAHLSKTNLWKNSGYISTVDPVTGATNSVLRIPPINLDYVGGEKLIVWMLGKWMPEGNDAPMIGDGINTSLRGWHIRVRADGRMQLIVCGATIGYGGSGSLSRIPFDNTLHDFGLVLDGSSKRYCYWVDGVVDANFGSGYADFYSATNFDTRTTNSVNIGSASPAPGNVDGIATTVRACVILRLPANYPAPSIASITSAFKQLRADPGKLILASAF